MDPDEQTIGDAAPQRPSITDGHEAALVPVDAAATVTEQQVQPNQEIEESGAWNGERGHIALGCMAFSMLTA